MPKPLNEELVETYFNDFVDLIEEFPNDLSRIISKLLAFDNELERVLNKIDRKSSKMIKSKNIEHISRYMKKIEKYLNQMTKISDQRLEILKSLLTKIQNKGQQLTEDYEGLLLSDQTQSLTYGTRSGRLWTPKDADH